MGALLVRSLCLNQAGTTVPAANHVAVGQIELAVFAAESLNC